MSSYDDLGWNQKLLLSIDPGLATGISLWRVPSNEPLERVDYWLVKDGLRGFMSWVYDHFLDGFSFVVLEEFIQDGRTPRVDTNALEIQGYLKGTSQFLWPENQKLYLHRNSRKTTVGDKLLKQHGFWLTGRDVAWTDGRDVNDSQLHALAWAKDNHAPSREYFWPNRG